jgi:hypothetical protein
LTYRCRLELSRPRQSLTILATPLIETTALIRGWKKSSAFRADHLLVVGTDAFPFNELFLLSVPTQLTRSLRTLGSAFVILQIERR